MSHSSPTTQARQFDVANVDMAAAWDGPEGDHWTDNAERYEATNRRYGELLLKSLGVRGDEDIVDIGCGTGRSTRDAARLASAGSVLGLDLSSRMLGRARAVADAEDLTNVRFAQGDAQVYPFAEASFDAAISLFGAMFFNDPTAAFANVRRALRRDGRLALLAWRDLADNEWVSAIRGALAMGRDLPIPPPRLPGPFAFADRGHAENVLHRAHFAEVAVERVDELLWFGADAEDAFSFVSTFGITKGLTQDLDDPTKVAALDAVRAVLRDHETEAGVRLGASAWLITAKADA